MDLSAITINFSIKKNKHLKKINLIIITILVWIITLFSSLYPHYYAYRNTPEGYTFSGQASWFDPWDINVYVSAINWGQNHGFLMENVYDSNTNKPIFYYPLYTLTGNLIKNIDPFILFYGLSIITSFALVVTIIIFIEKIHTDNSTVFLTTLTMLFAGGLGFLTYPYHDSLDSSMTSFSFHSAIQRPHEGLAVSAYIFLLMSQYYYFFQNKKNGQKKWLFSLFLFLLVTLIFYPYYLLSFILIGSFLFICNPIKLNKEKTIFWLALLIIGTIEVLLMQKNLSSNDSFSGVVKQKLSNPTIGSLFLGYGLLLIPFLYNLFRFNKLNNFQKYFIFWAGVSIALSFLPLGFARFFLRSALFPLVILTIDLLKDLSNKFNQESSKKLFLALLLTLFVITSMTSFNIFFKRLNETKTNNPWYFINDDDYKIIEYLKYSSQPLDGVLSSYYLGNLIPAYSNNRVFLGHSLQTPDFTNKATLAEQLYSCSLNEEEAKQLLLSNNIKYVVTSSFQTGICNYSFFYNVFSSNSGTVYSSDLL